MRVAIVTFSALVQDSRVLRTARTIAEAGHELLLIGYRPAPPDLNCYPVPGPHGRLIARCVILGRQLPATLCPSTARGLYWMSRARPQALNAILRFKPDVVHANDWNTLPIAVAAKKALGCRVIYDTHELATAEFEENVKWRIVALSHVRAIEKAGIAHADSVVTVSSGIAEALREIYPDAPAPVVIRNLPHATPVAFRATGDLITILWTGNLRPNNGLEALIESVARWKPGYRLVIRGNGPTSYIEALQASARNAGAAQRIEFAPSVPPSEVIRRAAESDVGVVLLPGTSRNNRMALPNKLFEYIQAGLGVISSPLPAIAAVIEQHRCGVLAEPTPAALTAVVNALRSDAINRWKRNALAAARELCWEAERDKLIGLYEGFAARQPDAAAAGGGGR